MTSPTPGPDANRVSWNSLKGPVNQFLGSLGSLLEKGNRRQLILKSADGRTLLRAPVTLALLLGLVLLWQAAPFLIVALIIALVLKVQFIVARDVVVDRAKSPPGG